MGNSLSAKIFYGIKFDNEQRHNIKNVDILNDAVETWVIATYSKDSFKNDYTKYRELAQTCPIEAGVFGMDSYLGVILYIKGTLKDDEYGHSKNINPLHFTVNPEWYEQLKSFCEIIGIPFKEPGWHIVATYW